MHQNTGPYFCVFQLLKKKKQCKNIHELFRMLRSTESSLDRKGKQNYKIAYAHTKYSVASSSEYAMIPRCRTT
jgi:hypothetical protein